MKACDLTDGERAARIEKIKAGMSRWIARDGAAVVPHTDNPQKLAPCEPNARDGNRVGE